MCGIVGLFLKDRSLDDQLGSLLNDMLVTMTDRGPDSAGIAIYNAQAPGSKLTLQSEDPDADFADLASKFDAIDSVERNGTHAVVYVATDKLESLRAEILATLPGVRAMSRGESIEIYKGMGLPEDVSARFDIPNKGGTHAIGHTRMATESKVTTRGSHPFSTGADQCLAHNGSLSNHNSVRRDLTRLGKSFDSQNDSEVAAAYVSQRMEQGDSLKEALESSLDELDGFFTFVVGTKDGFGVVRDPIACKPAVMAETDQYVAFGSEYRALVGLPGIEDAKIWEPEPATVYFWEH